VHGGRDPGAALSCGEWGGVAGGGGRVLGCGLEDDVAMRVTSLLPAGQALEAHNPSYTQQVQRKGLVGPSHKIQT
jgi:hypothetical protein